MMTLTLQSHLIATLNLQWVSSGERMPHINYLNEADQLTVFKWRKELMNEHARDWAFLGLDDRQYNGPRTEVVDLVYLESNVQSDRYRKQRGHTQAVERARSKYKSAARDSPDSE
ncbi:hypothetical protein OIV83_005636 [Microbotryomycetes sp. JL201]|nr:hypothetical protein OIV83_005636 [Microbotryomycetes sp. JL201]